jgi:hypothetical protein
MIPDLGVEHGNLGKVASRRRVPCPRALESPSTAFGRQTVIKRPVTLDRDSEPARALPEACMPRGGPHRHRPFVPVLQTVANSCKQLQSLRSAKPRLIPTLSDRHRLRPSAFRSADSLAARLDLHCWPVLRHTLAFNGRPASRTAPTYSGACCAQRSACGPRPIDRHVSSGRTTTHHAGEPITLPSRALQRLSSRHVELNWRNVSSLANYVPFGSISIFNPSHHCLCSSV